MAPVIFRVWGRDKEVMALFPAEPADYEGRYCSSYAHVGQHGSADYAGCVMRSRPATPEEYADLLAELKSYGTGEEYADIKVYRRATRQHRDAFNATLREMRSGR